MTRVMIPELGKTTMHSRVGALFYWEVQGQMDATDSSTGLTEPGQPIAPALIAGREGRGAIYSVIDLRKGAGMKGAVVIRDGQSAFNSLHKETMRILVTDYPDIHAGLNRSLDSTTFNNKI